MDTIGDTLILSPGPSNAIVVDMFWKGDGFRHVGVTVIPYLRLRVPDRIFEFLEKSNRFEASLMNAALYTVGEREEVGLAAIMREAKEGVGDIDCLLLNEGLTPQFCVLGFSFKFFKIWL